MTNEQVLELIEQCNIDDGLELIHGKAYLIKQMFPEMECGKMVELPEEIIVLVEDGEKAGGIRRIGDVDIHAVLKEEYRGKHIMSGFLETGILNRLWPENKDTELCGIDTPEDYYVRKHLAELCHMEIKNKERLDERVELLLLYREEHFEEHPYCKDYENCSLGNCGECPYK